MFTLTTALPNEKWCTELLGKARWSGHVACPYCNSDSVKKDGLYRAYQKYRCKCCRKWFNDKTCSTVFHYSHSPLKTWFLALYILFVLWPGCSIREKKYHLKQEHHITGAATDSSEQLWKNYHRHFHHPKTRRYCRRRRRVLHQGGSEGKAVP